jgi:ABC-type proline/glycine betaine transport system ATPase subunit
MAWLPVRGYAARNRYPATEHQLRHIFRNRERNGLARAFSRVGNRVLFSEELFDALAPLAAAEKQP